MFTYHLRIISKCLRRLTNPSLSGARRLVIISMIILCTEITFPFRLPALNQENASNRQLMSKAGYSDSIKKEGHEFAGFAKELSIARSQAAVYFNYLPAGLPPKVITLLAVFIFLYINKRRNAFKPVLSRLYPITPKGPPKRKTYSFSPFLNQDVNPLTNPDNNKDKEKRKVKKQKNRASVYPMFSYHLRIINRCFKKLTNPSLSAFRRLCIIAMIVLCTEITFPFLVTNFIKGNVQKTNIEYVTSGEHQNIKDKAPVKLDTDYGLHYLPVEVPQGVVLVLTMTVLMYIRRRKELFVLSSHSLYPITEQGPPNFTLSARPFLNHAVDLSIIQNKYNEKVKIKEKPEQHENHKGGDFVYFSWLHKIKRKEGKMNAKGFTLLELIIVIIIVGVLATLGYAQYGRMVERARGAEARSVLGAIRTFEAAYRLEHSGSVSATASDVGIGTSTDQIPSACRNTHYFSYGIAGSGSSMTATANRCTASGKTPNGTTGTLTLTTNFEDGSDVWGGTGGY